MDKLVTIQQELEGLCPLLPLCTQPTDIVMGDGPATAKVMFIGEAPGANEAIQRKPFVGRAGKLLNQTLEAIGVPRASVYITNIVKVRPPENRDPLPAEIAAFSPFLAREVSIIKPLLICTLGRFSLNYFLPDLRISAAHGVLQRLNWQNNLIHVLPQYHPAAALRGNKMKEAFINDMKKIPTALQWVEKKKGL